MHNLSFQFARAFSSKSSHDNSHLSFDNSEYTKVGSNNSTDNENTEEICNDNNESSYVKEQSSASEEAMLTHVDYDGKATMVDVANKPSTVREAIAEGTIHLGSKVFNLVKDNNIGKGDVMTVSKIAGIMGAKKTPDLIPLCHGLNITSVNIDIRLDSINHTAVVRCTARCTGKTGVEMEALTGVSVTLLTIYDMCKAASKSMIIKDVHLVKKTGGKSDFKAIVTKCDE